jgi:glycosyltransferase involved in cell wall biosynthesis
VLPSPPLLAKNLVMRFLQSRFVYTGECPSDVLIVANSTLTAKYAKRLWGKIEGTVFPPVSSPPPSPELRTDRNRLVTTVGTLEPGKYFGDIIEAIAPIENAKLNIIGNRRDDKYARYLMEKASKLKVRDRVQILSNLSDIRKWQMLKQSKVITHQKRFEPFGIALAEGMYAGAIPLVYRGEFSGPWIDIVERGKYGFGYSEIDELSRLLDSTLADDACDNLSKLARERAEEFSYHKFKQAFVKLVEAAV